MNRDDFIRTFARDNKVANADAKAWVNAVFNQLAKEISTNNKVSIRGVGTFYKVKRGEKTYRHPVSGDRLVSPASIRIKFTPSTLIDAEINRPVE